MKANSIILIVFLLNFFQSCKENNIAEFISKNQIKVKKIIRVEPQEIEYKNDTSIINKEKFILSIIKTDTTAYFKVQRKINGKYKTILVDSDFTTNNSSLFFKDENHDGYLDIVWTKKWQDHSYLFNPKENNFSEVGEFHDIDTLKFNNHLILFKDKYPLLFLMNFEKSVGENFMELHSELFVIDSNYKKISFATLDNFATLNDINIEKCNSTKSVVVNCYVPPYFGKFNKISIWNSGKSVDSIFMKADNFDGSFITKYWQNNYQKLLQYGQIFRVSRRREIKYF